MKIISYNVNGVRSAINKGLLDWVRAADPDVLCLQEIKACQITFDKAAFEALGYHVYLHPAVKKGYSGVAVLSRLLPRHVETGCGNPLYDCEGRMLRLDFEDYSVASVYMPSGSSGEGRQAFKMQWLTYFQEYALQLRRQLPGLVLCGDFNICREAIDIHNPKANAKSSGFLPEERSWFGGFLERGFVDTFRHFNQEPHHYTWWSYRAGARKKNLGWRIDYSIVTDNLRPRLKRATILPEANHSDHCPVIVEIA